MSPLRKKQRNSEEKKERGLGEWAETTKWSPKKKARTKTRGKAGASGKGIRKKKKSMLTEKNRGQKPGKQIKKG